MFIVWTGIILLNVAWGSPIAAQLNWGPRFDTGKAEVPNHVARKSKLLQSGGGTAESEAAVTRGLEWLASKQQRDGSWSFEFDGLSKDQVAATGLALLPFFSAREGPGYGFKYRDLIKRGMNWLVTRQSASGVFDGETSMFSHTVASMVLCKAAWLTGDSNLQQRATAAVSYIVQAQASDGSWGIAPRQKGDVLSIGWQIHALVTAKQSRIPFDHDAVFRKADEFLRDVAMDGGASFGKRGSSESLSQTPVGLYCWHAMGTVRSGNQSFLRGVTNLKRFAPGPNSFIDISRWYFTSTLLHSIGGSDWHNDWNPKVRDALIRLQELGPVDRFGGSWGGDFGEIGPAYGRLGTTALAVLTLQIYYRDTPFADADQGNNNTGPRTSVPTTSYADSKPEQGHQSESDRSNNKSAATDLPLDQITIVVFLSLIVVSFALMVLLIAWLQKCPWYVAMFEVIKALWTAVVAVVVVAGAVMMVFAVLGAAGGRPGGNNLRTCRWCGLVVDGSIPGVMRCPGCGSPLF